MGTLHELRPRKPQNADLFEAVRFDPLGEGERTVAVARAPAPEGWHLSVGHDLPCYLNAELDAVVTIMSSVDDHTDIWDHAFIALPAPIDRKALLDCIATFFEADRVWVESPTKEGDREIVAVHRCRTDERAALPSMRRNEERLRRRAHLRVVHPPKV